MARRDMPRFFSVQAVAQHLGLSPKSVRRFIASGDLTAHRIGQQLRISDEDFRTFVASRRE
jgi:excisionase family DNA binding protein